MFQGKGISRLVDTVREMTILKLPETDGSSDVTVVFGSSDITSSCSQPLTSRLTKCVSNSDRLFVGS